MPCYSPADPQVVYINEGPLGNIVILDPAWMGQQIFGPALSPENSVVPQLKSVTGRVGVSEIRRVYPEWDAVSILHLFQHFELCSPLDEEGTSYSFPGLIKMQPLFGLWEREPNLTVYAGIRLQCRDDRVDSFSPGLFPGSRCESGEPFLTTLTTRSLPSGARG